SKRDWSSDVCSSDLARLTSNCQRLLPILYMSNKPSISSCSEAPWGLSVLSRVTGIFTGTIISPSLSLRQCPNHYAFRAGRNLPAKQFRYLMTVIVTAAVYWGFNSYLRLRYALLLTFQHRAGVTAYTSPFGLAATCVFGILSLRPLHCGLSFYTHHYSRRYCVILQH